MVQNAPIINETPLARRMLIGKKNAASVFLERRNSGGKRALINPPVPNTAATGIIGTANIRQITDA